MKRIVLIVLILVVAVYGATHWLGSADIVSVHSVKPVAVVNVTREDLSRSLRISAELRPYQEVDLHAKVAGYLKFLSVDIGDQVKAGQVIAKIDTQELTDDLNRATAAYRDAKLDYDRVSAVIKKRPGLLAEQEVDNARAAYEMAKANMEHAKTFMDYATIAVPFDGVITKRYADPGAMIQASVSNDRQAMPIVHVAENGRLRLDFPVPESAVPLVHDGTPVEIIIAATGQKFSSTVTRTASKIDSSTRTMETEVDVDNHDLRLTPGMYAYVDIQLQQEKGALTLPVQAISTDEKPNVWRINDKNEIENQAVTLGMQTPDKVEILSGLKEGDKVVFGSRDMVTIGMKVEPTLVNVTKGG